MGIPRLRQLLEPYAEQVDLKGRDIVIDGPALVYHILYQCLGHATSLFNLPSYSLLGQTAIRWLNELSKAGANIVAIYFDGYLPSAKEPERKRRLFDLSKGLRSYFSLYPSGVPKGSSAAKEQVPMSFSSPSTVGGPSKKLPTPAFLVPAVLEALCASETYAPVIKLVPGEADIFCARHVSLSGGMIITSDSDLLVHDLGHKGSVTFFSSVEFKTHEGSEIATAAEYASLRICERLSCPRDKGLSSLAFQVSIDPQVTLQRAIPLAKEQANSDANASEYASFMAQYLSPEIMERVSLEPISGRLLDPRISELVLSLSFLKKSDSTGGAGNGTKQDDPDVAMYLPFLADSPARTSGWESSTSLRQLAYAVGRLLTTRPISSVVEYRRLQSLPGGARVEIPPVSEIDQQCLRLIDNMVKIRACLAEPELRWVVLAIHEDIVWSQTQGKGSILSLDMLQAEANGTLDIGTWDFVHLHAQVQGIYYSLRMLQQICDVTSRDRQLPDSVCTLRRDIGHISLLHDFPSISEFAVLFKKARANVDLPAFVATLGLGDDIAARVRSIMDPPQKKGKRKRSKRNDELNRAGTPVRQSSNPFDLLRGG
ncbi:hypothetical protein CONLIGDRAFT_678894 [Coniochaeta ligniaria NRRL 30616]|uniref:Asteroid domain-containing protein n=1 Tax=Coniochaeta ligniaria NRRL 30616 TaxID=1408157 RepID=A0A1J7IZA8_9PEZI|nr:hypothetical protein CONLIGDRAFT_678894 [Coniochaeta ligniaria NRRL 30616]